MSNNFISGGRRLNILSAPIAHTAGDLVYHNGFFGIAQDDWIVGRPCVLVMDAGEVKLENIFGSTLAQGVTVYAEPSQVATTARIFPQISYPTGAGGPSKPVGRITATGIASSATATLKVALFHPNSTY